MGRLSTGTEFMACSAAGDGNAMAEITSAAASDEGVIVAAIPWPLFAASGAGTKCFVMSCRGCFFFFVTVVLPLPLSLGFAAAAFPFVAVLTADVVEMLPSTVLPAVDLAARCPAAVLDRGCALKTFSFSFSLSWSCAILALALFAASHCPRVMFLVRGMVVLVFFFLFFSYSSRFKSKKKLSSDRVMYCVDAAFVQNQESVL